MKIKITVSLSDYMTEQEETIEIEDDVFYGMGEAECNDYIDEHVNEHVVLNMVDWTWKEA